MDPTTPNLLFPCLAPDSKLLQQLAALRRRLEPLLSWACKTVLLLIPVLFAVAHIAADGEPWNFATGEKFSPMFNVVSSYAWRSPAGWAMVACMAGFAFVMGYVSWHAMKRGPGFLAWFTAVVAAAAMVNLLEVTWYPFKPSKEAFSQIQQELKREPTKEMKQEMWTGGLYAMGMPRPQWIRSPEYLASLRSHWIHQHAIGSAQVLIMVAIMASRGVTRTGDWNPLGFRLQSACETHLCADPNRSCSSFCIHAPSCRGQDDPFPRPRMEVPSRRGERCGSRRLRRCRLAQARYPARLEHRGSFR